MAVEHEPGQHVTDPGASSFFDGASRTKQAVALVYCIILYYTMLYCNILCYTILYSGIRGSHFEPERENPEPSDLLKQLEFLGGATVHILCFVMSACFLSCSLCYLGSNGARFFSLSLSPGTLTPLSVRSVFIISNRKISN